MSIIAIDCFCGCGGTTRGFLDAGIRAVKGIDIDPSCEDTYVHNNSPAKFVCRDITEMSSKDVMEGVRLKKGDLLLLSGCAPCQPFSKHAKPDRKDGRRSLLGHFGRLVERLQPEFVFVENVPGIQRVRGNSTFRRFLRVLSDLEYSCDYGVLDA